MSDSARRRPSRAAMAGLATGLAIALALVCALLWAEHRGWPFLAGPSERWIAQRLQRPVSIEDLRGVRAFNLKLFGEIRLRVGRLQIANPGWSSLGPMFVADDATLTLRYRDLIAARDGQPLLLKALAAQRLALAIERRPDGRASWQFGARDEPNNTIGGAPPAIDGVRVEQLFLGDGNVRVVDALTQVDLDGSYVTRDDAVDGKRGLVAQAAGRYRDARFTMRLRSASPLPWLSADVRSPAVPLELDAQAGESRLHFDGTVRDLLGRQGLDGNFGLSGPSLATVGHVFGVTLPTTRPFSMRGHIARQGTHWATAIKQATVGRSQLAGEFTFDTPPQAVPMLRGHLRGSELWLEDLGPAIGVPAGGAPARPAASRVLPDRSFDLPSLAVMNADIQVALDRLELGHPRLSSMRPLKAHITLADRVLRIDDIDAKLAQGRVRGHVRLDARQTRSALWDVSLDASGLRLEQWIAQPRRDGGPPYAAGRIAGHIELRGRGRSTAELLATSDGRAWALWTQGTLSHLVVELAGIDIAQSLGVLMRGDRALPVTCGAAELLVKDGRVVPQLLVVDTTDSTIRADGFVSLADERLELVARVEPKDMSPLALRTPLHVNGTLASPKVSLDKGPLLRRLLPSLALAAVHPLAALLPLIDAGDDDAKEALAGCHALLERHSRAAATARRDGKKTATTG